MASATSPADWVDDYLARIGVTRPASADLQALRDLQLAHLLAVPFENLSIHLGEPIILDQAALVTKVTRMHRGGFCYELNGAFAGGSADEHHRPDARPCRLSRPSRDQRLSRYVLTVSRPVSPAAVAGSAPSSRWRYRAVRE
jgi:hypothetical protein